MSSLTRTAVLKVVLIVVLVTVSSCGGSDKTSTFDPETSYHPADWLPARHMNDARSNSDSCRGCHGQDLAGGITKVSCTTCHLGGAMAVHPATFNGLPWLQQGTNGHGTFVIANGTTSCRNIWCHGQNLEGIAQSGPACATCHPGEAF